MRIRTGSVVAVSLLILAGCGTTTPPPGGDAVSRSEALSLDEHENGQTVRVTVGTTVTVTLHSTYWMFGPLAASGVLVADGAPVVTAGDCLPGVGCGTVTIAFRAVGSGSVQVDAGRTSCGEAMACQPGQGMYDVTVVVGGS